METMEFRSPYLLLTILVLSLTALYFSPLNQIHFTIKLSSSSSISSSPSQTHTIFRPEPSPAVAESLRQRSPSTRTSQIVPDHVKVS